MLTLKEFKEARGVLSGVIRNTSLVYSPAFSKATGNQIYIKPENMQVTGAYKIRGAYYKISTLSDEEKARGLVTASAGNHAQGVAYAAQAAGVSATIVMPTTTPLVKVNNTKDYGAKVVLHGETFDDAAELAAKLSEEEGLTYVHPFNDPAIATGQGTISYEIFQDLPDVDVILVPIGGGGLATGVSTLAKLLNPNVTVIGVEPSGAASMKASLEAGHVVTLPTANTIADGVAVKTPGDQIFPYIQKNIDDIITIPDDELVDAFLDMMEKHKMIVENAGLLTIAALRAGKHVLCEKPMATTLADCEAMAAAARESGRFLMIGQNQRLTKAHQKARQLVADGVLGDILTFRTTFGHGGPETWSVDPGKNTWFFDKSKAAMGAMADLGIHKTDLIQYLLGQTVVEATAKVTTLDKRGADGQLIGVDDNAICIYRMSGGAIGTMTASWTYYGAEDNSTVLYGTKGILRIYDDPAYSLKLITAGGEKALYELEAIQTNDNQTASGVIDCFMDCLTGNTPPAISGESVLTAMRAVFACLESSRTGRAVSVAQD